VIATDVSPEELRDLYRELILDHARSPRHFGKLDEATHHASGINPLCGDKLEVYLRIDPQGRIDDASFAGTGCAISVASASLLTESVSGLTKDEALARFSTVVDALTGREKKDQADLGKLAALLGVREFPSRVKCATLSWHALNAAINETAEPATTE
jgi:nitrogen fixation NifU-like protein